jgi:catechol 2,3-dioxygenase-like lactoylglutathione lyase family enzyme
MEELRMKPGITLITLCVDDLEKWLKFYRDGLGLKTEGIIGREFEHGAAFFDLQAGLKLAIWPRLAHDSGLLLGKPSAAEFTLGRNVSSKAEVPPGCRKRPFRLRGSSLFLRKWGGPQEVGPPHFHYCVGRVRVAELLFAGQLDVQSESSMVKDRIEFSQAMSHKP